MNWQTPQELPDLRRVGTIALDTETNDEGLRADRGSAWPWRGGYVCGVSVAYHADGGIRGNYFPMRHPDSQNFERENVARWLKDLIAAGVKFKTQNGIYDWGWLGADHSARQSRPCGGKRGSGKRRSKHPESDETRLGSKKVR
jgi:hypothetical protein